MASETIIVYIDPQQVQAQKTNNYSLFLAKKVNGVFTVIWQSMGPIATVNNPSYEFKNTFNIEIPEYQVNYGNTVQSSGGVSFQSAGQAVTIDVGQTVMLDDEGLFAAPKNDGQPGTITIHNQLAGNPHEVLMDAEGNPVFFNAASGMDIGDADLTPVDVYQLWFDNYQDTGTMIAHNVSNAGVVTFAGESSQTISYNAAGAWVPGPLNATGAADAVIPRHGLAVIVTATFTTALAATAVTYIANRLISKFAGNLRPSSLKVTMGSAKLEVKFDNAEAAELLGEALTGGETVYERAVNDALSAARQDPSSGLGSERWTLSQPNIVVDL